MNTDATARREAPWSAAWSGEQAFSIEPSADFPGMLELNQKQALGVGEPLFGAMNATRLRRAMVDLLCHVCGKPTGRSSSSEPSNRSPLSSA